MTIQLKSTSGPSGKLPRVVNDRILWSGGIIEVQYGDEVVHGHFSVYLVVGSEKTILVDTGHAMHWQTLENDIESFLDERTLDYIFVTHGEFPHGGLLPHWMHKYPDAIAVGDIGDYKLYFPEFADRIKITKVGDQISLGDSNFIFVPAVWKDLTNTLWAFETKDRVLFVSDGFAYLHYHRLGQSDLFTSEMPPPDAKMIQFYNERALQWTKFTDVEKTFSDLDRLIEALEPRMICPAHGGVIDTQDEMIPRVKSAMQSGYAKGFLISSTQRGATQ